MKILKHLIKPAIGCLILFLLIKHGGLDLNLVKSAFQSHPYYLCLGFCAFFSISMAAGVRWFILVRAVGIPAPFSRVFSLHMIGLFFVTLMPGGTGGDVVKGYYIYRDTPNKKTMALVSIIMDRAIGVFTLLFWGVLGCTLNFQLAFHHPSLKWTSVFYLSMFCCIVVIVALFFSPLGGRVLAWRGIQKIPGKKGFHKLFEAIQVYRGYPKILISVFLFTFIIHGSIFVTFYLFALSLGVNLTLLQHAFVVPILLMVNGLPIAPGGMGVGEAAAVSLYGLLNVDTGGEILILFHICMIITALAGAPFYLFYKNRR